MPVARCSDTKLVSQAREGVETAWDELFRFYQLPLYAYARELTHDEQTSLDIVQETFVSALRHIRSLREDQRFGSWLFGIAHQKCLQHWRRQNRQPWFDLADDTDHIEYVVDQEIDPVGCLLQKEDHQRLLELLDELSVEHRSVLLLHFLEEFSLDDIAEITGVHLGTVKSRIHYAKKLLRQKLRKEIP